MDQLTELLGSVPEKITASPHFRHRVMRKIYLLKYRNLFYNIISPFSVILAFSLWRIWKNLFRTNAYVVMVDLVNNEFTITTAFFREFFATLKDIGVLYSMVGALASTTILLLCSLFLIYMGHTSRPSQQI